MIAKNKTASRNGKATGLIPACGYIRMSTDDQADSPAQQKSEIIKLAKRGGYRIIRWYVDEGISGDTIEKRPDFCRMLADAEGGAFAVILAWDQDRFGRFDIIRAGRVIDPLRDAGVSLVTVAQGVIDWNDFAGRMMYAIQTEGKHQFLRDLSRNALRGQIKSAERGDWHGVPPLGFDRQYYDERGDKVKLVSFGEKFRAPSAWRCRLAVSQDSATVELLRWIFDEYAWKEKSLNGIVAELHRRGVKSPAGHAWWPNQTIRKLIANPAYIGVTVFGQNQRGKYNCVDTALAGGDDGDGVVRIEDTHEAIIAAETFAAVQRKVEYRSRAGKSRVKDNSYALSGIARCGHCGGKMYGSYNKGSDRRFYMCRNGKVGQGCSSYSIPSDAIEQFMIDLVCDQILSDANLERQRADIIAVAKKRKPRRSTAAKSIKVALAKLEAKIKKGTERLLLIDDDAAQDASLLLTEWREERTSLKAQLDAAGHGEGVRPLTPEAQADLIIGALLALRENLKKADPARLRYVFGELFSEVSLWWVERVPGRQSTGKQKRYRFSEGLAVFATSTLLAPPSELTTSA